MDDLELLRDFRGDTQPASADRVARARAALITASERPTGRSMPRLRASVRIALAGVALAVPIAVVVLAAAGGGGTSGQADAAIIHRAAAAISTSPNEILHTKVVGNGVGAETWQLTSPPYSSFGMKGPIGHQGEFADDGTTSYSYDPSTNTIRETPSSGTKSFDDPLASVRQSLHDGRAQVLGSSVTGGVPTWKISFAGKGGSVRDSLIAYVDKRTYRPLLLADPQRDGTIVLLRVATIEYLPATPSNLKLLSMRDRHPRATVVADAPGAKFAPAKRG